MTLATRLSDYLDVEGADPSAVAIRCGLDELTRAELRQRVEGLADDLRELGAGPGDIVGVRLLNSIDAVVVLLAIWRTGAAVAPVSPLFTESEATRLIGRTGLRAFVAGPDEIDLVGPAQIMPTGNVMVASKFVGAADSTRVSAGAAVILHTSGTSGDPKAVVIEHASIIGALESLMETLGARGRRSSGRGAPNLLVFPLFHVAGIYNLVLALRNDRELILMEKFRVPEFVSIVESQQIPSVVLNPTMIHMLNEAEEVEPSQLGSLKFVRSGSAPLPVAVAQRFHSRFGIPVLNAYGQTETAGEVIGWTAADIRAHAHTKVGSVGRPHRNIAIRFVDPDGVAIPHGDVGELCVKSPFLMNGYLNDETADKVDDLGYLHTGDLGYVDEDGFVWLVGRRTDVIICGGYKVLPELVEDVLRRHPDVSDVMVAGVSDDRLGEAPHAFVVERRPNASLVDELDELARSDLAKYRVPRAYHIVDELPRNDAGKIVRSRAAELLLGPSV